MEEEQQTEEVKEEKSKYSLKTIFIGAILVVFGLLFIGIGIAAGEILIGLVATGVLLGGAAAAGGSN